MTTPEAQLRLSHHAAEARLREARVPAPPPQPQPESHTEAMAVAHQGAPSIAVQSMTHGAGRPALDPGPDPRGGVVG